MTAIIVAMQFVRAGRALISKASDFAAIGERIVAARRARGMRAVDLAAHTGIAPNTIAMWESGERRPNIENAAMLKAVLHVSIDWLFYGDDTGLNWQVRESIMAEMEKKVVEGQPPPPSQRKVTSGE